MHMQRVNLVKSYTHPTLGKIRLGVSDMYVKSSIVDEGSLIETRPPTCLRLIHRPRYTRIGAPISLCDPLWTPKSKGTVDT